MECSDLEKRGNRAVRSFLTAWILIALVAPASAGSLRDDYRSFVVQRQALEKQRSGYVVKIKTLAEAQRKATFLLYKCVTSRRGNQWAALLETVKARSDGLEAERMRINDMRKTLDSVRQALEQRRVNIEESHRRKGEGTPYETAFRQYMADLEETYFQRIKAELFAGYEAYLAHMSEHIDFLEAAFARCKEAENG